MVSPGGRGGRTHLAELDGLGPAAAAPCGHSRLPLPGPGDRLRRRIQRPGTARRPGWHRPLGLHTSQPISTRHLPISNRPFCQGRSAMSCLASTAGLPVSRLADNAEAVSIACRNRQALPALIAAAGTEQAELDGQGPPCPAAWPELLRLNSGAGERA